MPVVRKKTRIIGIEIEEKVVHKVTQQHHKRRCHRCRGSGRANCSICNGSGRVVSGTNWDGTAKFESCTGCFGLKTTRCNVCAGEGFA